MISLENKSSDQHKMPPVPLLFTRNVCSYLKRKSTNDWSLTFSKDPLKDNDGNDFKIQSILNLFQGDKQLKGTGLKTENLNNGQLLKFQKAIQIFARAD